MKMIPALPLARRLAALTLFFASTLAAFGAAPAAAASMQPGIVHQRLVAVQQDKKARLDLSSASSLLGLPAGSVPTIDMDPVNGTFSREGLGSFYTPNPGFVGRDQLIFAEPGGTLVLDLKVIPRFLPVAGRFDSRAGVETVGLLDNESKTFLLCDPIVDRSLPLDCKAHPLVGFGRQPLIPVAWPTPRANLETPAVVDIETGLVSVLVWRDMTWAVDHVEQLPDVGGWPLLGDWHGNGVRGVALVLEDGTVKVKVSAGSNKWTSWPVSLHLPAGDALVWPIVLQREYGPDAVALVDPETGDLGWLSYEERGMLAKNGNEECLAWLASFRQPLSWNMSPIPDSVVASTEVFYLEVDPGDLTLTPGAYRGGKPQTIPVKFPDDPPVP